MEHSAGESVRALIAERNIDTATVTANCRNSSPERSVSDRPVCGYNARPLAYHPAAKDLYPCLLSSSDHGMRRLANCWQLLFRDNHRAIVKRDQVPRHPTSPSPLRLPLVAISSASFCNRQTAAIQ